MELIRLCGVGLLCALSAVLLKQIKGEYASFVRVCGTVIIFGELALSAAELFAEISAAILGDGMTEYAKIMLKALGIAIVSKLCGDICRDLGENAVGSGVELGGKLGILALCVPLISELMGYASGLLRLG